MFSAKLGYWEGGSIPDQGLYVFIASKKSAPNAGNRRSFTNNKPDQQILWNNFPIITANAPTGKILYANNIFVAYPGSGGSYFGLPTIVTSPEGATWSDRTPLVSSGTWIGWPYVVYAMVYDGTKFIGYGLYDSTVPSYEGSTLTSTDGITWTASLNSTQTLRSLSKVIYQESVYVGIGLNSSGVSVIASSSDGYTWTIRQTAPSNISFSDIVYGNGRFVIVSDITSFAAAATGYYSDDGITWNSMTMPYKINYVVGAYGNNTYVAISSSGTYEIATSTDGITWTAYAFPSQFYGYSWTSIVFGNGIFALLGYYYPTNTGYVTLSSDGITWSTTNTGTNGAGATTSMAYAPS